LKNASQYICYGVKKIRHETGPQLENIW